VEIAETIMTQGPHYSRIDCPDCGFIKWGKKPGKEKEMAEKIENKCTFLIGVPESKKAEIALGNYEREELLREYSKTHHEFSKMLQWFDDQKTDPKHKEQFLPAMREMLKSCVFMLETMERAGVPDKMIADDLSLPF
jgi:hypothetical protein